VGQAGGPAFLITPAITLTAQALNAAK